MHSWPAYAEPEQKSKSSSVPSPYVQIFIITFLNALSAHKNQECNHISMPLMYVQKKWPCLTASVRTNQGCDSSSMPFWFVHAWKGLWLYLMKLAQLRETHTTACSWAFQQWSSQAVSDSMQPAIPVQNSSKHWATRHHRVKVTDPWVQEDHCTGSKERRKRETDTTRVLTVFTQQFLGAEFLRQKDRCERDWGDRQTRQGSSNLSPTKAVWN